MVSMGLLGLARVYSQSIALGAYNGLIGTKLLWDPDTSLSTLPGHCTGLDSTQFFWNQPALGWTGLGSSGTSLASWGTLPKYGARALH